MRERTEAGKLFTDYCEGLPEDRINCKKRMIQFNSTMPDDVKARMTALNELLGKKQMRGWNRHFYCCYGTNITIGEGSYLNFNCNFVDEWENYHWQKSNVWSGSYNSYGGASC